VVVGVTERGGRKRRGGEGGGERTRGSVEFDLAKINENILFNGQTNTPIPT
jgi:hypothetical protein